MIFIFCLQLNILVNLGMSKYLEPIAEAIARGKRPDITTGDVIDVTFSHDPTGDNYVWLWPYYGRLLWMDFQEPAGTGQWQPYDKYYFGRHGALVSHHPDRLVKEHVEYYVNPKTRKIALKFWFEKPSGEVYAMEPTQHFYELERDWFIKNELCQGHGAKVNMVSEFPPRPYVIDESENKSEY